ncbi:MAG TPA: hypothetical protein PK817_07895 [Dokdonella sp.]|jgi:hypothetical protein|nr:hypothetical protein [Dokdonella sp.]
MATGKIVKDKRLQKLLERLDKARTEEDVKAAWARHLKLDYDTSDDHDLYSPQVLFEFKYDKKLSNASQFAPVLAQLLYYLHRLKYHQSTKPIPMEWCAADKNEMVFGNVPDWSELYSDNGALFDWSLPPSNPDPRLVAAVRSHPAFRKVVARDMSIPAEAAALMAELDQRFSPQQGFRFGDKKLITEDNFEDVYAYWAEIFEESVRNGFKPSRYFVNDIQQGRTQVIADEGKVHFQVGPDEVRIKKILADDYLRFWSLYEKVRDPDVVRGILAKVDRLTDDSARRREGEFFTPLPFAAKALEGLERTLGAHWWRGGEYRLWDMAAGTGNLEYHLPAEAWPYLYLSTLHPQDVTHLERVFPGVDVFQYDYLNDDVGNLFAVSDDMATSHGFAAQGGLDLARTATWKMPERLRRDLDDKNLKWIVLINPPFATAQKGGAKGANKADVSKTLVRERMHQDDLGEVSRELFAQFLYRIRREFRGKAAWLGLFSKLKYINATNDQKFRDRVFRFGFERGFMFSSVNFAGTSAASQFPVGHLLWSLAEDRALEGQDIVLDVYNTQVQKIGRKRLRSEHRDRFLSKWIDRPDGIAVFPPFSSAITVKTQGPDIRDRTSADFIGSLLCAGNDIQHQNMTALYSGPYASAGGLSITPANFEQAMVVHAVRRLPKAEWHNDRDQFMQPSAALSAEFITDCTVWNLFHNSNHTVAMRDVDYEGQRHQIPNHFLPWLVAELRRWQIGDGDIAMQLPTASDRFVAVWLQGRELSPEALALLDAGQAVWRAYFAGLGQLRTDKFRVDTWDAGWWQVRNALKDRQLANDEMEATKSTHDALRDKLRPQLAEFGFLDAGLESAINADAGYDIAKVCAKEQGLKLPMA